MRLAVARIARAHGVRGEVRLEIRTDDPEGRLAPGAVLTTDPPSAGPLTVVRSRRDAKGYVASFDEISDRDGAEALRGVVLLVDADASSERDAWYPHELIGLAVVLPDGSDVGRVTGVEAMPAQDLLLIETPAGEVQVPLVRELVPSVDTLRGVVTIDPPAGLLEP